MPIPHLNHKIHSPSEWEKNKTSKILSSSGSSDRRFFDIKKNADGGKKNTGWQVLKTVPYAIMVFLFFAVIGVGAFAWLSKDLPNPDKLVTRDVAQSTRIYDRTGEHLLYEIHGDQKRTLIDIQDVPEYTVQATLALEDKTFYKHGGISLWGIFRGVVWRALRGKSLQGGSTLTQQLVKNAILTNERSVIRKAKEIILAYRIEKKYSKDEILQMYFNEIPYGSTAYGIEAASGYYFGKKASELTLAQATLLAALPQAPSYYSPWGSHKDALIARQHYALDQMVELGNITKEQAKSAKNEELAFQDRIAGIEAPHFVFFVKDLLTEKYGDKIIETGGLKIISTLDWDLQKKAEEIIKEQVEKNQKNYQATNASAVVLDVKTGQILAMVGSKDFFDESIDGQVNVAISPRQPGSSFKPFVYTAGFLKGYVPETILYDLETHFKTEVGEDYFPHDYDLKQRGPVSLKTALAGSLNIPAVKMIYLAGINNVLDLAEQFGYTTFGNRSRFGLSLVLGGGEVKLLEHLNGYATLSREGRKLPYSAVLKLEEPSGRIMEEFQEPISQKVIEPEIARMTTDILSDNGARAYIFGANNYLTLKDRSVAAKTGTTNDYHDAWTLGYTPQIAVGVWAGNSNNDAMKRGADGSIIAAPIWQKIMGEAVKNLPVESFAKPDYKIPNKPMVGGSSGGITVKINRVNGLLASDKTPTELVEEKTYRPAHAILYYVDKDDPLGPIPKNPGQDPYYESWEAPVKAWASSNNIVNEEPPTEQDNGEYDLKKDYGQTVYWTAPTENEILPGGSFPYALKISLIDFSQIQKIDIFARPANEGGSTWVNYVEKPDSNEITLSWNIALNSGEWILYPLVTDIYGRTFNGPERRIRIE